MNQGSDFLVLLGIAKSEMRCFAIDLEKRRNGFQRPFSIHQVITWVLYPIILLGFYALVLPMLPGMFSMISIALVSFYVADSSV